jgi:aspartate/methionine/tyrosine aminotransferase
MNRLDDVTKVNFDLDVFLENPKFNETFISHWDCCHPYYKSCFDNHKIDSNLIQKYIYLNNDIKLISNIFNFHKSNENIEYSENEIILATGSAKIISIFFTWLKLVDTEYIYYVPPLYYTFHFYAKVYKIKLRPITQDQLYEKSFKLNLPKKKCILIITDPIWYAGVSIKQSIINRLNEWQQFTGSTIFIDGSFQYYKWNKSKFEFTSQLDTSKTMRLLCPSKSIASNGIRCSYLLLPKHLYTEFEYILDCQNGSYNESELLYARQCLKILLSKKSNTELIEYTKHKYNSLINKNIIIEYIKPNCGYFIFAKLNNTYIDNYTYMDGVYFEQKKFIEYKRINLLSPIIQHL